MEDAHPRTDLIISRRRVLAGLASTAAVPLISASAAARAVAAPTKDLTWMSATELRELMIKREVSALEVTNHFLARIERLNPTLHAFVNVDWEGARRAARDADKAIRDKKSLGPLHGVPIAVKDQIFVQGLPATCGSAVFAGFRPTFDGTVVQRLRAAGAIILGTTNMPEFAAWPRSKSYVAGEAVNPWDYTRISGASSGGSGTAVAAGLAPVAIGTDGGGSTRIPAALCGLVGVLPTLGRVPNYGGFPCTTTGSAGPMARTVRDAAIIEQVISGPDPRIAKSIQTSPPDGLSNLESGVRGMRIAWSPDFGWMQPDPAVVSSVEAAVHALAGAGADVSHLTQVIPHPFGKDGVSSDLQKEVLRGGYETNPEGATPDYSMVQQWLLEATTKGITCFEIPQFSAFLEAHSGLLSPPRRLAMKSAPPAGAPRPEELRALLREIFTKYEVICSPTMPTVAPSIPPGWASPYSNGFMGTDFTFIANITACPAMTVPCGLVNGLPVGLQILGPPGREDTILRVARAAEAALPRFGNPPIV